MKTYSQPVSVGDMLEISVEKQGCDGDGLAFVNGLAVIVSSAQPGDEVTVRIEEVTDNCAFAEVWER